jgi:predicted Zn-dependent peptidase
MLGENMSSRLFQVVREDNGLAYSIASSLAFFDDVGALIVSAGLETDRLQEALKLITAELVKLKEVAPTAGELRRARDYVIGQMDMSLENTENQMIWMGEQLLGYGHVLKPDEIKKRLAEVTPSQIRRIARDFFVPERLSLALVSPLENTRGLDKIFAKLK